jgi:outer membrane protein TolC
MKDTSINTRFWSGLGLLLFFGLNVYSQKLLTKEQALQSILENNYAIKLSKNDIQTAKNNASIYNSKYLPSLALSTGAKYSNLNQEIETQSGLTNTYNNSETQTYNAALGVNYVIFSGFSRKYATKQLQEQLAISEIEAKATLEQAVLETFSAYYQTAQISENLHVLEEALQISKQRLKRTIYKFNYGQTTKLAVLNAEVDVNNDSINYINTKQLLDNSKRNLLLQIGDTLTRDFSIETSVQFVEIPTLDVLLNEVSKNTSLQQLESATKISKYSIKISQAGYLPTLGINTSYIWNLGKYPETSQAAQNMSYGLNAGLSLNWNIFDGGTSKTRVQNARINLENQRIRKEQVTHQLRSYISNTYYNYQNKRFVLQSQKENLKTAQRNFDRTSQQFKLGSVSSVEYRQAQLNLLNAQTAILRAKYDAKIVELQLLQVTGRLLEMKKY